MRSGDRFERLIPWYANGTLGERQRVELEEHLPRCRECRDQLHRAQDLMGEGRREVEAFLRHVNPVLLAQYADGPAALEPETVAWIERKLGECADCRSALDRLREVERRLPIRESGRVEPAARDHGQLDGLWRILTGTILRPAPALAYLIVALFVPAVWYLSTLRPSDPLQALQVVPLRGEQQVRDSEPGRRAEPHRIRLGRSLLLLQLETELNESDLADPALSFTVEIRLAGKLVSSLPATAESFSLKEGKLVLPVLLRAGTLRGMAPYEVLVRAHKPDDPLHGQVLFRRLFRLRF